MRNAPILSTRSRPHTAGPTSHTAGTGSSVQLAELCQVGVVLRTVLLVEVVVGVGALFAAEDLADWLVRVATLTGGAFPAALSWLAAACLARRLRIRQSARVQYAIAVALGAAAALYGASLLWWAGVLTQVPWLACALTGALLAAAVTTGQALRVSGRTPAATTARLEELQQRIRPHFLFNTLNSAIALVRHEPAKAEALLEDLSELFRSALSDPDETVTLADEIALAERYLAIEQIRFGERLQIRWSLDPAASTARLPKLLLQPLVENAVKHGVEPSPSGAKLRVRTERRRERVLIEVTNTLPPLRWAESPLPRGHGIALGNVRDRLRLLYDVQAGFSACAEGDSYKVRIEVPAG